MKRVSRVVCCKCQKDMPKEKTRYIGEGKRACKDHDGVVEVADKIYNVQAQKQEDKKIRLKAKELTQERRERNLLPVPKCFVCSHPIVDFPFIIDGKRQSYRYYKLQETPDDWQRIIKALPRELSSLADMVGGVMICFECVERLRFPDKFKRILETILR